MILGILVVLGLGLVGAVAGYFVGWWWSDVTMPNAGLEALGPPMFGIFIGGGVGIVGGIAWAVALAGRRDREE